MGRLKIPQQVRRFGRVLVAAGYECYLVGGAVRNILRGEQPVDFDVATDAAPREITRLFHRVIPTGIKHGTVTVIYQGCHFEATTFRTEGTYTDGRRPDSVRYVSEIEDDLSRRDFTVNAIAADTTTGTIIDPNDGRGDLRRGIIRAIGDPDVRFKEDGLRLMRACRFAATLMFAVDPDTSSALRRNRTMILSVSAERVRDELLKMLTAEQPSIGLLCMDQGGLLEIVLPELWECKGVDQREFHRYDVYTHLLKSCDGAPATDIVVRLAALFHDIGKPQAKQKTADGQTIFHRHEELSADITATILRRLRFPKDTQRKITHLVRHHMFAYSNTWSDAAVRRFLRRVGPEMIPQLFLLRQADAYGMRGEHSSAQGIGELQKRINAVLRERQALTVHDLAVNGNDLGNAGVPKGPSMGTVLEYLLEAVLDDPSQNSKEHLLEMAKRYYQNYVQRR